MYTNAASDKGIGRYLRASLMGSIDDENRVTHAVSSRGLSSGGHRRSGRARETETGSNAY